MVKLVKASFLVIVFFPLLCMAQTTNPSTATPSTQQQTQNFANRKIQENQLSDDAEADKNSFAHIEMLDRNVEETSKEIAALKKAHELKALKTQANKLRLTFGVLRIFGVANDLSATLLFDNRMVYNVKPGDVIEGRYKVEQITTENVKAYDNETDQHFFIPFAN